MRVFRVGERGSVAVAGGDMRLTNRACEDRKVFSIGGRIEDGLTAVLVAVCAEPMRWFGVAALALTAAVGALLLACFILVVRSITSVSVRMQHSNDVHSITATEAAMVCALQIVL